MSRGRYRTPGTSWMGNGSRKGWLLGNWNMIGLRIPGRLPPEKAISIKELQS